MTSTSPLAGFGALYERHSETVFRAALRVTGNAADAEDVLQTVFLRVLARGNETAVLPAAYFKRAAVNAAVDVLRRKTTLRSAPLDAADDRPADQDTAEEAARNVEHASVRAALEALPPAQRRTIELAYFGGYTHVELSELMGVPLGTVKGRMRIGLQKLRRALEVQRAGATR